MGEPTSEQLDLLLELQATDSRVRRLRHQLDDLPEQQQLEEAQAQVAELESELDEVRVELDRAGATQRKLEREIAVLTERRDAERSRLYDGTIANARQMKAIEAEVETTERRITEHEEQLLEAMEQVESLDARADELQQAAAYQRQRVEELANARDDAAKELLAELGELEARRIRQANGLPAELLERYEQVVARTGGAGVGKLVDNACTACRIQLSMADVGELLAGPPLTTCPQCHRLLVVPPE
ncbi:MAG: zinc ribbon domain-containing protein [Nitriliruptoraceae bacterium]